MCEVDNFDLAEKKRFLRAERYHLQSVSREVLPQFRVKSCLRYINGDNVGVHQHTESRRVFYSGLQICGSVWTCPVCAAKISERRRKELQQAFSFHKNAGGYISMLTLTFSHKKTDKLNEILKRFSKAITYLFGGRAFNNIRDEMDLIGRIRVLEVTWSEKNGFHPHVHIALFYNLKIDMSDMKKRLYVLWKKACEKVNLQASKSHGLDLQGAEEAEKYLSKHGTWSLDQELTKAHIKKGKVESLTPFDILRKYAETEDEKYAKLFIEYATYFKNKMQLHWSRGLKKHFHIGEKNDEELAKEKIEEADFLGLLDRSDWKIILSKNVRAQFLNDCETGGFEYAVQKHLKNSN